MADRKQDAQKTEQELAADRMQENRQSAQLPWNPAGHVAHYPRANAIPAAHEGPPQSMDQEAEQTKRRTETQGAARREPEK